MRVRLLAWGRTEADIDRAVAWARRGSGRAGWDMDIMRLRIPAGPLPLEDPAALAAEAAPDGSWAYAAYRQQEGGDA